MARPILSDDRRRFIPVQAYVTPAERDLLDQLRARLGGVSRSDALRECILQTTGVQIEVTS